MATKYIKSLEDFSIDWIVRTQTQFTIKDLDITEYDEGLTEEIVKQDIDKSLDFIIDKILKGCVIPRGKGVLVDDIKGYNIHHFDNFICVYNTYTQLKTILSIEYTYQDFYTNINYGISSDTKSGGSYNHPINRYTLLVLKSTYGDIGEVSYLASSGGTAKTQKPPILIKIGNGKIDNLQKYAIC